jgi:hypothetical protein
LVAWQAKPCTGFDIEVLDVQWVSFEKVMQTLLVDKNCWLSCLALGPNQVRYFTRSLYK